MPGTPNVDAADPFACCSMTAPDDGAQTPEQAAAREPLADELARLRAAIAEQPGPLPLHPAGMTVEQALAYVDDTVELRTPTERALARGYRALAAAYGESQRHQHDQAAELLVVRDAADRMDRAARETGNELGRHMLYARPVLDAWASHDPETEDGARIRLGVQAAAGAQFVADLDELAGVTV